MLKVPAFFIILALSILMGNSMDQQKNASWRSADIAVIVAGLFSTAAALFFVHWLGGQFKDFEIMGFYWLFIIPVGAILVGIGAGSGYGFVSWKTGRKISGSLMAVIVILLACGYALAQWVEFNSLREAIWSAMGQRIDFFTYFDITTRDMTLTIGRSQTSTGSLGLLGYLFRLLELAGFSLGGLFIPIILRAKPYCGSCSMYMRRNARWWLPAAVPTRKISKKDPVALNAFQRDMDEAYKKGIGLLNQLVDAVRGRDTTSFRTVLEQNGLEVKEMNKLSASINLVLHGCPQCRSGVLEMELRQGQADKIKVTPLGRERVNAGFVAALGEIRPRQRMQTM